MAKSLSELARTDPFDLGVNTERVTALGVPTMASVAALEAEAMALYKAKKDTTAAVALDRYGKAANWLANVVGSCLAPFYDADYETRENFPRARIDELARFETLANDYRGKRDLAMVMEAECLLAMNDPKGALPLLMRALELIPIDRSDLWDRARVGSCVESQA